MSPLARKLVMIVFFDSYQKSRQFDLPLRAMQALEIILKSVFLNVKGVQVRSRPVRIFYRLNINILVILRSAVDRSLCDPNDQLYSDRVTNFGQASFRVPFSVIDHI